MPCGSRAARGDDQARRRDRCDGPVGVSRSKHDDGGVWHSAAACGARDNRLSGEQPTLVEQLDGAGGYVGDSADNGGAVLKIIGDVGSEATCRTP